MIKPAYFVHQHKLWDTPWNYSQNILMGRICSRLQKCNEMMMNTTKIQKQNIN